MFYKKVIDESLWCDHDYSIKFYKNFKFFHDEIFQENISEIFSVK